MEGETKLAQAGVRYRQRRMREAAAAKRWAETTGHAYAHTPGQIAWADKIAEMCQPAAIRAAAERNAAQKELD